VKFVTRAMPARLSVSLLIAIALLAGTVAHAQDLTRTQAARLLDSGDVQERRSGASRLGEVGTMPDVPLLLRELRDPDEEARDEAQQAIWRIWSRSGDPEIDRLYETGVQQMNAGDLDDAIATFTRIIKLKPEFAEGWNKRATLYFLAGDMRKSLADCDEVMKRNPYHFGALSGYMQIYIRLEHYDRALEYGRRALEVNPNLGGVRQSVELLQHAIEQRRNRAI
jgi:tetratricopeptide (TPR) repeat protein